MRAISSLAFALTALSLVACGDDGGDIQPIDAGPIDTPPANCSVSTATFGEKGAVAGASTFRMRAAGVGDIRVQAPLEAAPPADILIVEFYTGYAPFGTSAAPTAVIPGTYQISGTQLQYADCGICVRIGTNADTQGYEDDYLATGGTVTVTEAGTAVGGNITFTLSGLTFEHVTIDEETFVSTAVGDGCGTAISGASHTSVMAAAPAKRSALIDTSAARKQLGL